MFGKKVTKDQQNLAYESLCSAFGEVSIVDDAPLKEYLIKWLSAFAPDMTYYDAKSFCLPRRMYKNYIWNAFSFQKTDCYIGEDAVKELEGGFEGPCYVLLNGENLLCEIPDGRVLSPEAVSAFSNIVVFTKDFSETYVHTGIDEFGPYYKSAGMALADEDAEPEDLLQDEAEPEE